MGRLVHAFPARKAPATGVFPFFGILEHKLGMHKFTGENSLFPGLECRVFPNHLAEDGTVRPGIGGAITGGSNRNVIAQDDTQGIVVDAA